MNSEKIIIELSRISTPTGLTCSGDVTLDDSTCDEIIEYITGLEEQVKCLLKQKENFEHLIANDINTKGERKDNLIKYLEDKIKEFKDKIEKFDLWHEVGVDLNFLILQKQWYQELLERIKNSNYET